ncbi:SDR family oxidoreductase [Saccharopolyspora rosea]|uniref:SDR family oxidoreductase n=1 Tax=Saccharopolyspora rosea TaxID=524884 RepID=UPI0031E948C8
MQTAPGAGPHRRGIVFPSYQRKIPTCQADGAREPPEAARNATTCANGLSPGPTVTDALKPLGAERQAAIYEELRRTVPRHRLGTATEMAKAAIYLASDESAYTVGTVLRVDGGIGELAY